jgi:preprotein translocase subunit SecD
VRRRRAAWVRLVVTLVVVLGAGAYFLFINPLADKIHKGLDLQGGIEIVYQASGTPQQPYSLAALERTVQVIELRINRLGVSEPVVQAEPATHRILVELAGVKNPEQAQQVIGTPAVLQFKDSAGHVIVTGSDLEHADAEIVPGQGNGNVVALTFNAEGRRKLAAFTSANVGKYMPIYIDGKMIMNPVIQQPILNGQAIITGNFTFQQAQDLATELNSGALPLDLTILSKQTVSATLGADSVRASRVAAVVALALVAGFMLLVYRVPGLWADVALLVYALLLLAVLLGIHATLTLPGITGLILSIGMAVDSNVIIYERIKEELRGGRSLRSAVDEGFRNGLRAIIDSNATTLIAAIVLYYLGSGLIRGFAVTLGVGILISLLTAVVFTRYLLHWLVDAGAQPSFWFFAPRGQPAAAEGTRPRTPAVPALAEAGAVAAAAGARVSPPGGGPTGRGGAARPEGKAKARRARGAGR